MDIMTFKKLLCEVDREAERQKYIKSLQLKQGENPLTDTELRNFVHRSNGIANSPAQISAINDINAMNKVRLQQVINHKKTNVLMKHRARKRLSGEWE